MAQPLGIGRFVVAQLSFCGTDNGVTLGGLRVMVFINTVGTTGGLTRPHLMG